LKIHAKITMEGLTFEAKRTTISASDAMIKKIEKTFKALGDLNRLKIINMLSSKALCVCEMTAILKISQSTVSGHLRVLKEAGLVEDTKDGLWVEYRLCQNNAFSTGILHLIAQELKADEKMSAERELADQANREVLCKK